MERFVENLQNRGYFLCSEVDSPLQEIILSGEVSPLLRFFRKSIHQKETALSKDRARRGYSPCDSENFATLIGEKKGNDSVEKFRVGPEVSEEDRCEHCEYFSAKSSRVHFFPNNWDHVEEDFRLSSMRIYNLAEQIMRCALDSICEGLVSSFSLHTSILSLNYYSINESANDSKRIADHKDVSFFTIVSSLTSDSNNNTRLQVFDMLENEWKEIPIEAGGCVILAGEYLEYVSGGQYKAVLHRVVNKNENNEISERQSFAFFVAPNYNAKIDLRLNPCNEDLMIYDEWRKWKVAQAIKVGKR